MKMSCLVSSILLLVWVFTLLGRPCVGEGSGGASGREKALLWWPPLNNSHFWREQGWRKAVLHRVRLGQKALFAGRRL